MAVTSELLFIYKLNEKYTLFTIHQKGNIDTIQTCFLSFRRRHLPLVALNVKVAVALDGALKHCPESRDPSIVTISHGYLPIQF